MYDQDSEVVARYNMLNQGMNEAYQYNNLGELTKFQRGSRTETWNPDALGNFSSVTNDGSTQTNTFNQQNQYSSGGVTYDADGNLTADGKGWTYTYDAWNRLITANYNNSPVATYSYDGLNRQVQIIENNCTTDIYYSSQGQAVEEYINGSVSAFDVWSPVYVNALVFRAEVYPKTGTGGNVIRYYALQDANWNITAWVDNLNGSIDERYAYDPYGAITVLNPDWSPFTGTPLHLPFGFQGMRTDWFVGNLNFSRWGRVENPSFGTWMQMDPLGEATGPNGYEAFGNQPTDLVDPSGDIVIYIHGVNPGGAPWIQQMYSGYYTVWLLSHLEPQIGINFGWTVPGPFGGRVQPGNGDVTTSISGTLNKAGTRQAVQKLIRFIARVRRLNPNEPINIVAHSEGAMIALAALSQGAPANTVFLLNPPISIKTGAQDLARARDGARCSLYVFWSPQDGIVQLVNGSGFGLNKPIQGTNGLLHVRVIRVGGGHSDFHTAQNAYNLGLLFELINRYKSARGFREALAMILRDFPNVTIIGERRLRVRRGRVESP